MNFFHRILIRGFIFSLLCFLVVSIQAQYAPAAGFPGSTAISADSSIIAYWANEVSIVRGPMNIANPSLGNASYGEPAHALGAADQLVVSLGDGGTATFRFEPPLYNREGYDFAVFENGFSDLFLELCFVEISSDGDNFVRFPALSNTPLDNQVGPFSTINPVHLYNLAGKYRVGYGTPFDFAELAGVPGLDINQIEFIRLVDVIGNIDSLYANYDSEGKIINDPWPTEFESGGFDLDALAVLAPINAISIRETLPLKLYPQPCRDYFVLEFDEKLLSQSTLTIYNQSGRLISDFFLQGGQQIYQCSIAGFPQGVYFYQLISSKLSYSGKLIVID